MQTEGIFNKHIKIHNAQYLNSFVPFFWPNRRSGIQPIHFHKGIIYLFQAAWVRAAIAFTLSPL